MPSGIYKRTQVHLENVSKSQKGKISHRKGMSMIEEYGFEKAKEIKRKLRKPKTEEHKRKIVETRRKNDSYTATEKTKRKISKANRGKKKPPRTEDHKRKLKKARKLQIMKPITEETRKKMRLTRIKNPIKKFSGTSIELKMRAELDKRGFVKDKDYFCNIGLDNIANVDIYLPAYKIVIECDGCRYHACHQCGFTKYFQDRIKNDAEKARMLKKAGYKVYRFWEHDIKNSAEKCINKIIFKN